MGPVSRVAIHLVLLTLAIIGGGSRAYSLFVMPIQLQRDLLGAVVTGIRPPTEYVRSDGGPAGLQLIWRYDLSAAEVRTLRTRCRGESLFGFRDSCILRSKSLGDGSGESDAALVGGKLQIRAAWL
jgi:hypothetical protein